jgi:hypothetical protein
MNESNRYIQIYKGSHYLNRHTKKEQRVIVFDLDETLGAFLDLHILWTSIQEKFGESVMQFHELLDLYPEFLRYGILSILEYLCEKKRRNECDALYIYTNNQCSSSWTTMICDYLNKRIYPTGPLFDKIIHAFKINNTPIELKRTTHEKKHSDFIKCAILPKTTEICFLDNTYFEDMRHRRIYYIQPRSYYHHLSTEEIIYRFLDSDVGKRIAVSAEDQAKLYHYLSSCFYKKGRIQEGNDSSKVFQTDVFVAQKMMYHIKEFFYLTNRKQKTRRIKFAYGKLTRKKKGE